MQHTRIYHASLPSEIFPKYGNAEVEWEKTIANRLWPEGQSSAVNSCVLHGYFDVVLNLRQ